LLRCVAVMLFVQALVALSVATIGFARSLPNRLQDRQDPSTTADAAAAQATICGDIVDAVNEGESNIVDDGRLCL
jgi:hypothetical protein